MHRTGCSGKKRLVLHVPSLHELESKLESVSIINIPAASLDMALVSLIEAKGADLEGSKILMFSYGSGLAAGMFVLKGRAVPGAFALHHLRSKVRLAS